MAARDDMVEVVLDAGGFIHGYTYAGNPLACAAGVAVLEEITGNDLIGNAERIGARLKDELTGLMTEYPFIGDVRGMGLLLAFETVSDRRSMSPLPKGLNAHSDLVEIAYREGLIIYSRRTRGGVEGDHFMVCPPLISESSHIDEIMQKLRTSLDTFAARHGLDRALASNVG
jgi:adenosylmethionine-8-amino-7-oxononanoate aminotransferase